MGQKWVSLALFSILSAQNIIIAHPTWFYPSSGMKKESRESQYFGKKNRLFLLLMRFMRIDAHGCALANIGTWPTLVVLDMNMIYMIYFKITKLFMQL